LDSGFKPSFDIDQRGIGACNCLVPSLFKFEGRELRLSFGSSADLKILDII
jgi:hypothetical protein